MTRPGPPITSADGLGSNTTTDVARKVWKVRWWLAVLITMHAALLAWGGCRHSPSWDEWGHLPAGISHWYYAQFDLYRVNPPLIRMVGVLPVLADARQLQWPYVTADMRDRPESECARAMLQSHGERVLGWFVLARWTCIPISVVGAGICFRWAAELYGPVSGLVAAALWCFSPAVLGHGQMITPDVGAAAVGAVAGYSFWRWLQVPSLGSGFGAGVLLGLAQLTKFTWIMLFGLWPLLWLSWRLGRSNNSAAAGPWHREAGQLGLILGLAIYVINLGYAFEGTGTRLDHLTFLSQGLRGARSDDGPGFSENRFSGTFLGRMPIAVPANYLLGIDRQKYDFENTSWSYLRGEWRDRGWWYYYVYGLLVKEPLGTWWLLGVALTVTITRCEYRRAGRAEIVVLAPLLAVLVLVSTQTGFTRHLRYVLPALPFAFIWISKVGQSIKWGHCKIAALAVIGLVSSVGSSLFAYPHSLAYFNELAGGPRQGAEHLLHSNVDWGQDLLLYRAWLKEQCGADHVGLCYSLPTWVIDPARLGVSYTDVLPGPGSVDVEWRGLPHQIGPLPGWYAIFVGELYARHGRYAYFHRFEPVERVGYTVLIYHITPAEANRVRRELGLPEIED